MGRIHNSVLKTTELATRWLISFILNRVFLGKGTERGLSFCIHTLARLFCLGKFLKDNSFSQSFTYIYIPHTVIRTAKQRNIQSLMTDDLFNLTPPPPPSTRVLLKDPRPAPGPNPPAGLSH